MFTVTIIFVLEIALSGIPNVQLTTVLFMVSFQIHHKIKHTDIISITLYIALQGVHWGFGFYLIGMYAGWFVWMIIAKNVSHTKIETQAFVGFLFAFIYGMAFYPLTGIIYQIPFTAYMIADFPYAIMMGVSNFITILWLKPLLMHRIYSISHENRL